MVAQNISHQRDLWSVANVKPCLSLFSAHVLQSMLKSVLLMSTPLGSLFASRVASFHHHPRQVHSAESEVQNDSVSGVNLKLLAVAQGNWVRYWASLSATPGEATPAAASTPAGSGDEARVQATIEGAEEELKFKAAKGRKKLTRKQLKEREDRRRARTREFCIC